MERLTEKTKTDFQCNNHECKLSYCDRECERYQCMIDKLAAYEDAEEAGLLHKTDVAIMPIIKGKLLVLHSEQFIPPNHMKAIRDNIMHQIAEGVVIIPDGFSYELFVIQQEGE